MFNIPWTPTSDDFDDLWEDYPPSAMNGVPDMLETMFAQQLAHMQAYSQVSSTTGNGEFLPPELWGTLVRFRTQAALRENAGYVVEELYEAINLLKNKPWKETAFPVSEQSFREELADVWHFFIQFHILAGISPLDVFKEYFRKSLINEQRRANGY